MNEIKLFPLRIGAGWYINTNNFCDVDFSSFSSQRPAYFYLHTNLLLLYRVDYENSQYVVATTKPSIDVGWYPDGDIETGQYVFRILNPNWDNIAIEVSSRNAQLIIECVEIATSILIDSTDISPVIKRIEQYLSIMEIDKWQLSIPKN